MKDRGTGLGIIGVFAWLFLKVALKQLDYNSLSATLIQLVVCRLKESCKNERYYLFKMATKLFMFYAFWVFRLK